MSHLIRVEGSTGLYARIGRHGRRAYYWRGRVFDNETGQRRDVRRALGVNLERAVVEARKLDEQAEAVARGEPIRREMTLGAFVASYIVHIRDERRLLGWRTPASNVEMFSKHVGPDRLMRRIARRDVEGFLEARRQRVRPATVNSARRDVRRLLAVALDRGLVDRNVAVGVKPVKGRPLPVKLPSDEQLRQVLGYLETRRPWLHLLFMVLLGTGCRLGEALRATWGDYDPAGGRLVLRRRKVSDLLDMPLRDPLKAQLWQAWVAAGMPKEGPIIVGRTGTAPTPCGALNELVKVRRSLGMPWLTLATARKWSSTVADEVAGLNAASKFLGHSNTRTTEGYIRGGEEAARCRAVEAVAGALNRAVASVPGEAVGVGGGS